MSNSLSIRITNDDRLASSASIAMLTLFLDGALSKAPIGFGVIFYVFLVPNIGAIFWFAWILCGGLLLNFDEAGVYLFKVLGHVRLFNMKYFHFDQIKNIRIEVQNRRRGVVRRFLAFEYGMKTHRYWVQISESDAQLLADSPLRSIGLIYRRCGTKENGPSIRHSE